MTYADAEQRLRLIAGLRALTDFLETRPEVPAPCTVVFVSRGTDNAMRAETQRAAALISSQIDPGYVTHGQHRTARDFGPVQYRMVAVLAESRARHDALISYSGAVVPDTPQEA